MAAIRQVPRTGSMSYKICVLPVVFTGYFSVMWAWVETPLPKQALYRIITRN